MAATPLGKLLAKPWAGVAVLFAFYLLINVTFAVLSPFFLTFRNLIAIGTNVSFMGLMAAFGTPLIIAGGLDLSVAAVAGLTGIVIALQYAAGVNIWLACLVALLVAAAVGAANGTMATKWRMNPLIVTLGTMSIVTGTSLVLTGGLTKPLLVENFNWIGSGRMLGIPIPIFLLFIAFAALWLLLTQTRFGRLVYASGSNQVASRLVGVPVDRIQMILYICSALSGAVAGIVLAAMLGAAAPDAAGRHLLTVIAAIILGGTSLFGGRGSVWGTLLAVLILGTLTNGLTLMNVSSFWQDVTRGVVLLAAVGLDQIRTKAAQA